MLDIIDLTGLASGEQSVVRRVAGEIGRACRDVGFFDIRNHGVPEDLLSGMFDRSQAFFR